MDIKLIRDAIKSKKPIEYTAHCQKRMLERSIRRKDIIEVINNGRIIEDYPLEGGNNNEKSFPSCLILGYRNSDKKAIHVVIGFNGKKLLFISACYPDKEHWLDDNMTRRK